MESQAQTRQPNYGMISPEQAKALTGLELLKSILEGRLPGAPMSATLQLRLLEVEHGRAVFSGQPSMAYYNPAGSVHGGYAATLLDSCMGCAIHSTLPAGTGYTTLEFKISFLRPLTEAAGSVRAEGKIISVGKRVGTAEGWIFDSAKRLYAHGTTTCLIFPL